MLNFLERTTGIFLLSLLALGSSFTLWALAKAARTPAFAKY
jgi:hypothetical protein